MLLYPFTTTIVTSQKTQGTSKISAVPSLRTTTFFRNMKTEVAARKLQNKSRVEMMEIAVCFWPQESLNIIGWMSLC